MKHPVRGTRSLGTPRVGVPAHTVCHGPDGRRPWSRYALPGTHACRRRSRRAGLQPARRRHQHLSLLPLWVKFTTPIDATTLTSDTFYLTPLGGSTKVPATLTYVAVQKRATLTPTTLLTDGVTYRATVTVGIKDDARQPAPVALDLDVHDRIRPSAPRTSWTCRREPPTTRPSRDCTKRGSSQVTTARSARNSARTTRCGGSSSPR